LSNGALHRTTLTFKSRQITRTGADTFDVNGTLTIRAISRAVTLKATFLGTGRDPYGHEKMGFEAVTTLNRKDYGLNWNAVLETGGFLVGDEVKVVLSIQAAAKGEVS
jgi:polyisoprenoid-binding protein YceI